MAENSKGNTVIDILEQTISVLESQPLPKDINNVLEKCLMNIRFLSSLQVDPILILTPIKNVLLSSVEEPFLDYTLLVEFLDKVLGITPFDTLLKVFSIKDLEEALLSSNTPLIISALRVLELSSPKSIFASSPLLDLVLKLYFVEETDLTIVNKIEDILRSLATDELVTKRILENNRSFLLDVKEKAQLVSFARLLELLSIFFSFTTQSNFDEALFIIGSKDILEIAGQDGLFFIHIVNYYSKYLEELTTVNLSRPSKDWVYQYLEPVINTFGSVYKERETFIEVKIFAVSYLFRFFRSLSYWNYDNCFHYIDEVYLQLNEENENIVDFLSFVEPKYLLQYHHVLMKNYSVVTPTNLSIIRNVVSTQNSFNIIKENLKEASILELPYMEQMVLLERLSQFEYSIELLKNKAPRVLENLINFQGFNIVEPETVRLREDTLVNLLSFDSSLLGSWYTPIADELYKLRNSGGGKEVKTKIESMYL